MRRLLVASVMLVMAAAASAGCSPKNGVASWSSPKKSSGPDTSVGSTYQVCGSIRTAVSADMAPLGKAFGAIVGNATANDTSDLRQARSSAQAALTKLGADITAAAAGAKDAKVKTAAGTAGTNIAALAADPSYLSGIDSMGDITTATAKLTQATAAITTACQGT